MKTKLLTIGFLAILVLVSGCLQVPAGMTPEQAVETANMTAEVKAFLGFYGNCEDCNPAYSEGKTNLIGCVEYEVKTAASSTVIEYWISDACSFRYLGSREQKISITINPRTGEVMEKYPKLEYIENPGYCEKDTDCGCISGSGVLFIGCGNFLHGPIGCCGYYECGQCRCINSVCTTE